MIDKRANDEIDPRDRYMPRSMCTPNRSSIQYVLESLEELLEGIEFQREGRTLRGELLEKAFKVSERIKQG